VPPALDQEGDLSPQTLVIPEIRDYQKINAEVVALLDRGHQCLRLEGAEGQRLLASGLSGHWQATIEIVGRTGPEAVANLDAPNLTVIVRGHTADGAARGLKSGRVVFLGDASVAAGYGQSGGILLISGSAGPRAGLCQSGGTLAILGEVGRLASDRQAGGLFFASGGSLGPQPGRGRRGGRLIEDVASDRLDLAASSAWGEVLDLARGLVEISWP